MKDDGTGSITVEVADPSVMLKISLEFGEFLYQLRAALDGVIYEGAVLQSGANPPPYERALQFPICSNPPEFHKARKSISPLSDECRSFLESIQPYNAPTLPKDAMIDDPARCLGILGELARKDRHRRLHAVGLLPITARPQFNLPAVMQLGYLTVRKGFVLENDGEIATFRILGYRTDTQAQVNPNLTFQIAIMEAPPQCAENDTFNERTRSMLVVTDMIVNWFEAYFEGKL